MSGTVIVSIISLLGTMFGTLGGIITAGKLTNYRIGELEKRVNMLLSVSEKIPLIEKEQQTANHRIKILEQKCEYPKPTLAN